MSAWSCSVDASRAPSVLSHVLRQVALACLALGVASLGGCNEKPEDAVLAQYHRGEKAIAAYDVEELKAVQTGDFESRLAEILRLAREATPEQAKQLPASVLPTVLALRNRLEPERLRSMRPNDLLVWMIEQHMLVVDKDYDILPHHVEINGDRAKIHMGIRVEAERRRVRVGRRGRGLVGAAVASLIPNTKVEPIEGLFHEFANINGYWYFDCAAEAARDDQAGVDYAKEEGEPLWKLMAEEEEAIHESLKPNVWEAPR